MPREGIGGSKKVAEEGSPEKMISEQGLDGGGGTAMTPSGRRMFQTQRTARARILRLDRAWRVPVPLKRKGDGRNTGGSL